MTACRMDSLRLFRGACRHVPFTFVHLRLLRTACSVRAHLDMRVHRADTRITFCRESTVWVVHLRNRGDLGLLHSSVIQERGGSVLASLVSMALILDEPSRTFSLCCPVGHSLSSAWQVSSEARFSLLSLAHVVRGSMGQTGAYLWPLTFL